MKYKIQGDDAEALKAVWSAGVSLTMPRTHYKKLGYSDVRHRWDIFWNGVKCNKAEASAVINKIYKYANDNHMDTLFKNWQQELETTND